MKPVTTLTLTAAVIALLCSSCSSTTPPATATSIGAVIPYTAPAPTATRSPGTTTVTELPGTSTPSPVTSTSTSTAPELVDQVDDSAAAVVEDLAVPGVPVTAPPAEPRLFPETADYTDPETVAAVFFAAWCWQPVTQPVNMNLAAAGQWTTSDGWADLKARAIPDAEWDLIVAEGVSSACGPVQAIADGPASSTSQWVKITTTRVDSVDGQIVNQYPLQERWQILQDNTGRWLVDVRAAAN